MREPAVQRWVRALEIAGPGFVNLRLADAAKQAVVAEVLAAGEIGIACVDRGGVKPRRLPADMAARLRALQSA